MEGKIMPKKYIKKEKKMINYKSDSFNHNTHKLFVLFEDISKEILSLNASSPRWLANALTVLSRQDKVKVSKATIDGRIFRSYHYTTSFKNVLYEKEPQNYPQFSEVEKRNTSTYLLGRATRISDSMCMGIMAGIEYEPQKKPALKVLCGRPSKETKKEDQNSNKNGQSLSVIKSNLIQEYGDLSFKANPNFIPNYDNSINKEKHLKEGVIYASYEMGVISQLSEDDVNHNKFTSMTGIILTDEEAYCLYHAGQGKLSWLTKGEITQAHQVGLNIASLYPQYGPLYKVPNCVIFVRKMNLIEEVVNGYLKGNAMHEPGTGFERAHIIPVSKEGVELLRCIAKNPSFCNTVVEMLLKTGKYQNNPVNSRVFPVKRVVDSIPHCVLVDMDIMKCREINRVIEECDYERVTVICLEWQQEWLKRVLPESTNYAVIRGDVVEKIVEDHIELKDAF
jgi:hypothetical protein